MVKTNRVSLVILALAAASVQAAEGVPAAGGSPPASITEPTSGMALVWVKGGCFRMGDVIGDGKLYGTQGETLEEPVHEVCVGDYYIGKYEVTRGEWKAVMGSLQAREEAATAQDDLCEGDRCPIGNVTWNDVQAFIARLNAGAGGGKYRLPTEAEWEFAARGRGRTDTRYSGGNDLDSVSWSEETSGWRTAPDLAVSHPVGRLLPNDLGLYDMSGNQWELVGDWFGPDYYKQSPRDNPTGPPSDQGQGRAKRGGCASGDWYNARVSRRSGGGEYALPLDGFRLVKVP